MRTAVRRALTGGGRTVALLSLVSLLTDISSEMTLHTLPIFLTSTLGISVATVGMIEGIAESTAAGLRLFAGRLSDRLPRRLPLVVAGYGISALTKPLFALVAGAPLAGVLRFSDRVGKGVRSAPRDALIADVAPGARRGLVFGLHRAADTLGAAIGVGTAAIVVAAVGHGALTRGDFQRVVLIAAVPAFLAVLVLTAVRERPRERAAVSAAGPLLALPGTAAERRYLAVVFLFALGNSSDAFIVLRLVDLGAGAAGALALLVLMNIGYLLVSAPAGWLSDRIGRRRLLFGGYLAYAAIYLAFAAAGSVGQALPLMLLYGVYYGATEGAVRAYLADLSPAGRRGATYGWYYALIALAALPASVVAGVLWVRSGPGATFVFGAACALAAAALLTTVRAPARPATLPPAQGVGR